VDVGLNRVQVFLDSLVNFENVQDKLDISPVLSDEAPEGAQEAERHVKLKDVEVEDDKVTDLEVLERIDDGLVGK